MRANIVKASCLCAAVSYLVWVCTAAWAVYGVKMADLHRNPLPPNPVRTWGTVSSVSPMKVNDGKNEVVVSGLNAQIGDLVIVTGNWNGSVLSITDTSRIFAGPAKVEMICIPAGSFLMGNNGNEPYSYSDEFPQHSVTLSAYSIGKYEVTRGEYRKFINAGGYSNSSYWSSDGWSWKVSYSRTQPDYWGAVQNWGSPWGPFTQTDNRPVVGVSYYEAEAYCKWAGGRLPTEAEWERAARWNPATSHPNTYPWGDTWNNEYCNNLDDSNAAGGGYQNFQTAPVGSYSSYGSPSGCQDMAGNVCEWCADWYSSTYYSSSPSSNPSGPASGICRVIRGGDWLWLADYCCRCASRGSYDFPYTCNYYVGFRMARSATNIITASSGSGGTISPSGAMTINNGGGQTFTIIPDTGYSIADVLVDGVSQGAISSYTFTNVIADHTISASFSSNNSGEMISIHAGSFLMGNSNIGADATYRYSNELPQHTVYLSAYSLGKYEVTRGEYRKFINAGGYSNQSYWSNAGWAWKVSNSRTQPSYWDAVQDWGSGNFTQTDNHPVVGVSYYEAEAYCKWAGGRLPTEAEWERAARWNPVTSHPNVYPWCDTYNSQYCNTIEDSNPAGGGFWEYQTAPVGSYSSYGSPSGCQDMAGNVYEWCADWYSHTYYSSSPSSDPPGPATGDYRVVRGGAWDTYYPQLDNYSVRCAERKCRAPGGSSRNEGFRLAR